MTVFAQAQAMRACPFCGKGVHPDAQQCPFCREAIPEVYVRSRLYASDGRAKLRRGGLYVLLAGIIHYFAAGYSGLTLPVTVPPAVTTYGTPALFICGLGLILYGAFLYLRS